MLINEFVGNYIWNQIIKITNFFINIYDINLENFKYGFFPSSIIQLSKYKIHSICPKSPLIEELANDNSLIEFNYDEKDGLYWSLIDSIKNKDEYLKNRKKDKKEKILLEERY